jgi:hypothetical protein
MAVLIFGIKWLHWEPFFLTIEKKNDLVTPSFSNKRKPGKLEIILFC